MPFGPVSIDHTTRLKTALGIADRLSVHYGAQLLAIGLYGSVAQSADGPYSDIEMHCVLDAPGVDRALEWTTGDWKAEINLAGINVILKKAAAVEPDWPIVQGAYVNVQPVFDPSNLFIHLKKAAISQPATKFSKAIKDLIVGEMYELAGKIRNAGLRQSSVMLAYYAVEFARWGACLIGLDNRYIYPLPIKLFSASLELDNCPMGYEALCRLVMAGDLSDSHQTLQACEDFWQGVNVWARLKGLRLENELAELLKFLD
jgi:kanamycin nucleotidyltransferase